MQKPLPSRNEQRDNDKKGTTFVLSHFGIPNEAEKILTDGGIFFSEKCFLPFVDILTPSLFFDQYKKDLENCNTVILLVESSEYPDQMGTTVLIGKGDPIAEYHGLLMQLKEAKRWSGNIFICYLESDPCEIELRSPYTGHLKDLLPNDGKILLSLEEFVKFFNG